MKRMNFSKWLIFLVTICAMAITLAACNVRDNDTTHSHIYSAEWTYDSEYHWHKATCEHTNEIKDKTSHIFNGDVCTVCKYNKSNSIPSNPDTACKVTFNANGGELTDSATKTVDKNTLLTKPSDPTRSGFVFNGWAIEENGKTKWDFTSNRVTESLTLYAQWLELFSVTFNANGGEFETAQTTFTNEVKEGDKLTIPTSPTRDNFEFTHWFTDDTLTTEWNFETDTVTKPTTLYAGWKYNEVNVTYVLNYAGTENVTEPTVDGLVTYIPTRVGYVFNGWWISDGQTADGDYILAQKWDTTEVVTESGLILYAEWVEKATVSSQLTAPSVSINGNVFSWDAISNAVRYDVRVYKSGSNQEVTSANVSGTSWTFPNSYDAGYYNVKIRAIGDGLNTVNSSYVTKSYGHLILAGISSIDFDISTSVLTWSTVKNATAYELYVNNTLVDTLTYATYDLSEYEAGNYQIKIVATRTNYQSSTTTKTIEKKRLKTPEVNVYAVEENASYVLMWDNVLHADTYIIVYGDKEIRVNQNSYAFDNASKIWNDEASVILTVNAYDSNADYLISINSSEIELSKLYKLTTEASIDGAGTISVEGMSFSQEVQISQSFKVTFDYNYTGSTKYAQIVTSSEGLEYPSIPTRSGYVFRGWYKESSCRNIYDFTSKVTEDITLYASWYSVSASNCSIIDATNYNSSSRVYSISTASTSSSNYKYTYFAVLNGGTYYLYYANGYSGSNYATYIYVYNATQNIVIQANASISSTSYTRVSFSANAGDVIYVRNYRYNTSYSSTFKFYVSGANKPEAGGKCDYLEYLGESNNPNVAQNIFANGQEITVTATTIDENYIFVGWFNGDVLITDEPIYTFAMPLEDVTYTAKWIYFSITTEKNVSEAGNISSFSDTPTKVGKEITITATTNNGYTWLGWYNGETKLTDEPSYTFAMPAENVTYIAKWTFYTLTISDQDDESESTARVQFNLNGASGTAPATQIITKTNKLVYPTIPTRSGYVFAGWYDNSSCSGNAFNFSSSVTEDIILYAKWVEYSGNGVIPYNGNITINVVSKSSSTVYYAFVPLVSGTVSIYSTGSLDTYGYLYSSTKSQLTTDDDSGDGNNFKITYTVTAGTLYYVRPCGYNSSGTTTVYVSGPAVSDSGTTGEANKGTVKVNGSNYSGNATKITAGQNVTVSATTNNGYTWVGWYNGETELTKELSYTFIMPSEDVTYTAKWIKVNIERSNTSAGTISSLTEKYKAGDEATITATTNNGYTWVGWYNGETELTKELSYTFTMPSEDVTYTAKWVSCPVSVIKNLNSAGTISGLDGATTLGEATTITVTTNIGFKWIGWYNGDVLLTTELSYTFIMPLENVSYTAKWEVYLQYINNCGEEVYYTNDDLNYFTTIKSTTLSGWYVFLGTVAGGTLTVSGEAHIILADDCSWSLNSIIVPAGATLNIYAQSIESNAGQLIVNGNIGGTNGGKGKDAQSSGSGDLSGASGYTGTSAGTIVINGGVITATNIGGGNGGMGGQGRVRYSGYSGGAGGDCAGVIINGGNIQATNIGGGNGGTGGTGGSGFNDGKNGTAGGSGGVGGAGGNCNKIIISGGTVKTTNIGGGSGGKGGTGGNGANSLYTAGAGGSGGKGGTGGNCNVIIITSGTLKTICNGNNGVGGSGGFGGTAYNTSTKANNGYTGTSGSKGASAILYFYGTQSEWEDKAISTTNVEIYFYTASEPTESGNYWHYDADGITPIIWAN